MTQVSKRYLAPDIQKRMYEIFVKTVSKTKDEDTISLLTDLLSPTERVMLAKRVAIAYLLIKGGCTTRYISETLKVSLTTIDKVSLTLKIKGRGYRRIIKNMMRDEKIGEFIESLFDAIPAVPPKGRNWSNWRREQEIAKAKRQKAF